MPHPGPVKSESPGMRTVDIGKLSSFPGDSDEQPRLKLASVVGFVLSTSDNFVSQDACKDPFLVFTHYVLVTTPPSSPAMATPDPPNISCPWLGERN